MNIVKIESKNLKECADIIFDTELGKKYYPTKDAIYSQIKAGMITGDKIYVAKDLNESIKGIVWYQQEGMFHVFPYLHMIAVKSEYQHQGMGQKLLDYFEYDALISSYNRLRTKVFLTVGEFNINAERLYINRGYSKICEIENLYRKNITEKLYMKIVRASDFQR